MFRGRVTGVYVAIITLAALVVGNLVIIDFQAYTGGFNGITDLAQLTLFGITFDAYERTTYYLVATCVAVCLFLALAVTKSKAGLIMQAIRDQESRVRYFGYDVAGYKVFAFAFAAAISASRACSTRSSWNSPRRTFLGVPISLSVVIWCAVGGRGSLLGAFLGAVVVAGMQGFLSEDKTFLESWTLIMGAVFVLVVLFLPKGLAGIGEAVAERFERRRAVAAAPSYREDFAAPPAASRELGGTP